MILKGKRVTDERGSVTFINDFDFNDVKRFYIVRNAKNNFFRGWHGHKNEAKYVFVVRGKAKIAWQDMEADERVGGSVIMDGYSPQILCIPPGNANAARNLTKDTEIMYFSTSTLEESLEDDYRFPEDRWTM